MKDKGWCRRVLDRLIVQYGKKQLVLYVIRKEGGILK